jgi:predicted nucleic acid-binding protein
MRILIDTNVALDVLLNRDPWVVQSSAIWQANDEGQVVQIACANLAGLDAIVTRDRSGFQDAPTPVLTPAELLIQLGG